MQQGVVEKAMRDKGLVEVCTLLRLPALAGEILKEARCSFGDRSWIMAGLTAIESGHPEEAVSAAVSDFFTTLEVQYERETELVPKE